MNSPDLIVAVSASPVGEADSFPYREIASHSACSPRHSATNSPLLSTRAFAVLLVVSGAIAALALLT